MKNAPEGYVPHLFRVASGSKAPALEYGSWKSERNKLSGRGALEWLKSGGNVGIAGMPDDPLVNVDIDDNEKTEKKDMKPTLMARSRSRDGLHAWYFSDEDIPNIPTDNAGEVRAQGQYVVAPGSFVPSEKDLPDAGYYTVEEEKPVSDIIFEELPDVFLKTKEEQEKQKNYERRKDFDPKDGDGEHSAIFDIEARDIVLKEGGSTEPSDRWAAIFHGSETGMNMSMSREDLLHCWRHNVSHNGLQALTVLSGYLSCKEAGSPHKRSGAGRSEVIGNDGAVFHAWVYAKRRGYIPEDDPIPSRALNYIAKKEDICEPNDEGLLPPWAFKRVVKIVEEEY